MNQFSREKLMYQMGKNNMTQAELGRLTGVSTNSISCLLTGKTRPRSLTLGKLACALNCEISDLMTDDQQKGLIEGEKVQP